MTQQEVLTEVLARLSELGAKYALTGSHASSYWGQPRSTHDIDLLVLIDAEQAAALAAAMDPDYYADAEAMVEAITGSRHFNLIHLDTGVKIDFWIVRGDEYGQERFARRVAPDPERPDLVVLTPEDVILSKLLWMREGAGGRQRDDIEGVLRVQGRDLDTDYLRRWAARLGLTAELAEVLGAVE